MSTKGKLLFLGRMVSPGKNEVSIFNGYLSIDHGKITSRGTLDDYEKYKTSIDVSEFEIVCLSDSQFLLPGFVDCHVHAPQFPNLGLGLELPLLDWLAKYTFPLESEYCNVDFAAKVYDKVVPRLLKNGTTTACYFGSIHVEGTLQLARSVATYGQRALVGKVSMNVKNDAGYYNSTKQEVEDTEKFIQAIQSMKNHLVQPILTPRFAISCDVELMNRLGVLSRKHGCRIQTHISENVKEVEAVLSMFEGARSYTDVYDQSGLINSKCVLAHGIHLSEEEMRTLAARGASIAHCPASNTRLLSGLCPVGDLLRHGITVGLGTDVSGGDSTSILDAARRCLDVAAHRQLLSASDEALTWKQALYMATLGGAAALGLDDKIGDFSVGKELDAVLVDVYSAHGPLDLHDWPRGSDRYSEHLLERFFYSGDDRNIERVYVSGVEVKQSLGTMESGKKFKGARSNADGDFF